MFKKLLIVAVLFLLIAGCAKKEDKEQILIGLSMADLKEERWLRDRDMFVARAESLGAKVIVQDANGDPNTQVQQCENMLVRGINVLVVIPKNADAAAPIVEKAHKKGVKTLSYDRIIANADVDLYVSFNNERVGEIQAGEILKRVPKGKYAILIGDPGDKNAGMVHDGHMNILKQPVIDKDIEIVFAQACDKWSRMEAKRLTEDALAKHKFDALIASNDGTASGAIAALEAKGLAGKIPVSGQDADLLNCQYIVQGKQAVTVYKPIKKIAEFSAEAAVAMAKGREVKGINAKVKNGKIEVPTVFLDPIPVTKENIDKTVIADGYHSKEEVYQ